MSKVVERCPKCGRKIVIAEEVEGGVTSEYVSANGLCWNCTFPKKRK